MRLEFQSPNNILVQYGGNDSHQPPNAVLDHFRAVECRIRRPQFIQHMIEVFNEVGGVHE